MEDGADALWQALLDAHGRKAALGWLATLMPVGLQGHTLGLQLRPGQRAMVRFLGPRQQQQLAQMLSQLTGLPMKVDLNLAASGDAGDGPATSHSHAGDDPNDDSGSISGGASGGGGVITAAQRQAAMDLPLVRELLESFDLSLVEVRQGEAGNDSSIADNDDEEASDAAASDDAGADAFLDDEYEN